MWYYVKTLEYPVNLKSKDLMMAKLLLAQYGGPDGELAASLRYLNQRYTMPTNMTKGLLNDIGTEEMAHVEIIATMAFQIMQNASPKELEDAGLGTHYVDHGNAVFPCSGSGVNFTTDYIQTKGEPIADLTEDMAAEQKARVTYEHLISLTDEHDIKDILKFLRAREIVHFQRFGEALQNVEDNFCDN